MSRPLRTVLVTVVLIALVFAAGGGYAVFGPNTPAFEGKRGVKIPPGSAFETVLDSLSSSGVIASPMMVGLLGNATGWGDQVKAGYYEFEAGASSFDVLSTLRRGLQTPIRVRIPQGSRLERIAEVAGREMAFGPDAFFTNLDTGIFLALGLSSVSVIGILIAGWSSANKYSLLGAARVVAQFISYELPMVVTLLAVGLGALFGNEYNIFDRVELPRIPLSTSELSTGGIITAIAVLVLSLLAAMLGGMALKWRWRDRMRKAGKPAFWPYKYAAVPARNTNTGVYGSDVSLRSAW